MLNTINGFLAAAVDSSMVMLLNNNERLTFNLSPLLSGSGILLFFHDHRRPVGILRVRSRSPVPL